MIFPGGADFKAFIRPLARSILVSLPLAEIKGTLTLRKDLQPAVRTTLRTDSLEMLASFATLRRLFVAALILFFQASYDPRS